MAMSPLVNLVSLENFWFPQFFHFSLQQSYPLFVAPITPRLLGMDSELQHKWLGLVQHQQAHLWIMPQHSYLDSVIVFCLLRVLLKITSGTELDVINPETVKSYPSLRMMIPKTCKLLLGKLFQNQSAFNRQKPCPFLSQNIKAKDIIASDTSSHLPTTTVR